MTPNNRYGAIAAEIYDIDKPFGSLPDAAFYLDRFASFEGAILEPACGSGRVLVPLLEAGLDVAGFDPSPEMLARCESRCAHAGFAPELKTARFEDFAFERRFSAIVIPSASFTLIDDFEVAVAVLRRFHAHLESGGRLMLDIDGLADLARDAEGRRRWTNPEGELLTLHAVRTATDWLAQRAEGTLRYERWRGGLLMETQMEVMAQRYWGLEEFRLTLEAVGFAEISVCGNYEHGRAPRPRDRIWTFEAFRA